MQNTQKGDQKMVNGEYANENELMDEMKNTQNEIKDNERILDEFLKSANAVLNNPRTQELNDRFEEIIPDSKKSQVKATDLENIVKEKRDKIRAMVDPTEIYAPDYLQANGRETISTSLISKLNYYANLLTQSESKVDEIVRKDIHRHLEEKGLHLHEKYFEMKIKEIDKHKDNLLAHEKEISHILDLYRGKREKVDKELLKCEEIFDLYDKAKEESIHRITDLKKKKDIAAETLFDPQDIYRIEESLNKIQDDQEKRELSYKQLTRKYEMSTEMKKRVQNRINSISHHKSIYRNQIANHESYSMLLSMTLDEYRLNEDAGELFLKDDKKNIDYANINSIVSLVSEQTKATDDFLLKTDDEEYQMNIKTSDYTPSGTRSDIGKYEAKVSSIKNDIEEHNRKRLNKMFNDVAGDRIEYKDKS